MKLATRYQRTNLLATLIIFLLAGAAFYVLLHRVLIFQVDEDLEIEQHEIQSYASRFGRLPQNVIPVEDQMVRFEQVNAPLPNPIRQTVTLEDEVEKEEGAFRQLIFTVKAGGQWYKASVSKSLESTEGLTRSIGLIALITIGLMLLVSFLINRIVLRRLWKPFYNTIERMRTFELGNKENIVWPHVPIEEFALLNKTLETATGKAALDYEVLKEFTENASHELQTPLAIIRSKLDLLIQDEALSETQSAIIQDTYGAVRRMAHLNQSLLLLAKVEGGQYADRAPIDLEVLLKEKLISFEEFIRDRRLNITTDFRKAKLNMNPALADILLNNLLSNAILHNYSGGILIIKLSDQELAICNTSATGALDPEYLFSRFYKTTAGATRTGLGLAITKQVCEVSGYRISYSYTHENMHCFSVGWKVAAAR